MVAAHDSWRETHIGDATAPPTMRRPQFPSAMEAGGSHSPAHTDLPDPPGNNLHEAADAHHAQYVALRPDTPGRRSSPPRRAEVRGGGRGGGGGASASSSSGGGGYHSVRAGSAMPRTPRMLQSPQRRRLQMQPFLSIQIPQCGAPCHRRPSPPSALTGLQRVSSLRRQEWT